MKNKREDGNIIIIVTIIGVILIVGAGAYYFGHKQSIIPTQNTTPSLVVQTPTVPLSTPSPTPTQIQNSNPNLKTFTSSSLGISFTYLEKQDEDTYKTSTERNKVYIYNSRLAPKTGQSIEVFQKDAADSLDAAIKKKFLARKSEKDCFVKNYSPSQNNYPSTYKMATISYPTDENDNLETMSDKAAKCGEGYAMSNGLSYFLMDTNNPNKFFFLSIGQYGIKSDGNKNWQETLQILD